MGTRECCDPDMLKRLPSYRDRLAVIGAPVPMVAMEIGKVKKRCGAEINRHCFLDATPVGLKWSTQEF